MKRVWLLGVVAIFILLTGRGYADIYRWTDAKGTIHFTNDPPPPGGVLVERIEEVPYDAEADRRRREEDREWRLERRKQELEERQAAIEQREREARIKLEEANRTLEQAQQQAAPESREGDEDCSDEHYSRYGSCAGYPVIYQRQGRPRGNQDPYRGYTRKDGSLYYQGRPKPPPAAPPGPPKDNLDPVKPKPKAPKAPVKDGKAAAVPEDPRLKAPAAPPAADSR